VKYELIGRIQPERDAPTFNNESNSIGVFLMEMIDDRSIQVEVFPGLLPTGVAGFTDAAVVYARQRLPEPVDLLGQEF
jgi:hypothetical protein